MAHDRIEIDPKIMTGKPVIRGTRIPVETVLRELGAGMAVEEIIHEHPRLTAEDVRAAQAFAADYLADEEIIFNKHTSCVGSQMNASTQLSSRSCDSRDMTFFMRPRLHPGRATSHLSHGRLVKARISWSGAAGRHGTASN